MTPTAQELTAGRKAFHRIQLAARYIPGILFGSHKLFVAVMAFGTICLVKLAYEDFREGDYLWGAVFAIALAAYLWQWRRQRVRYRKDFEFLRQLKLKYGPEIYSELEKEPSSLYYAVFQKLYPPDSRRISVTLP